MYLYLQFNKLIPNEKCAISSVLSDKSVSQSCLSSQTCLLGNCLYDGTFPVNYGRYSVSTKFSSLSLLSPQPPSARASPVMHIPDFENDPRISFDKGKQNWVLEDDNGNELEWDSRSQRFVSLVGAITLPHATSQFAARNGSNQGTASRVLRQRGRRECE